MMRRPSTRPLPCATALTLIIALVPWIQQPANANETEWRTLVEQLQGLLERGQYAEAVGVAEEALTVAESVFGKDHPHLAISLARLGWVYGRVDREREAEPLLTRSLAIQESALGANHPDVAESLVILAVLYRAQARYAEADPLLRRALTIYGQRDPDGPDVGRVLNDLGELLHAKGNTQVSIDLARGDYVEAEALYKRALAVRERSRGPEHRDTAATLNSLATLYDSWNRLDEAEPLYRRALAIYERVLGPQHTNTATVLADLGSLYRKQGRYDEAGPLLRRALSVREEVFGPHHRTVADSLYDLARLYQAQAQLAKAVSFYQRALTIREGVLRPDHPDTAQLLEHYALALRNLGRAEEAALMEDRAKRARKQFHASQ